MKYHAGYVQTMLSESQNVALGTNLSAKIKTIVKIYLGWIKEIGPVVIYSNILNFKIDLQTLQVHDKLTYSGLPKLYTTVF